MNRELYDLSGRCDVDYFINKNYQDLFIGNEIKTPYILIRNVDGILFDNQFRIISNEQALQSMNEYDELVYKVSYGSGHGRGVRKVKRADYEQVINSTAKNYVIQILVKQHPFLASFNDSSVNIIRITTLNLYGEILVLGGIFRIGAPGSFCDHTSNGNENPLIIGLDEDGRLYGKAVDPEAMLCYGDVRGKLIVGEIPAFGDMLDKAKRLHEKYPKFKLIGWDFTVDEVGDVICIEYNPQIPGIVQTQLVNGPIFGRKLKNGKTVLDEIKGMK